MLALVMMNDSPPDEQEPTLGMDLPVATMPATGSAYRVLARKYRPQKFSELIGQDAMVQTLANAIRRDRIAHAFLMTGVRGVGKTSTARLIAKGLNCIGVDGQGGPTIEPCGTCDPCVAIAEGRHIDVIEMDAASHTGVDDVREIIEAVRYSAVSARYKIYIIDEVHMLSKNAFNALLKTLEEPPPHVKFIFATTEVNKVPITVLSRCQRFDLRRITADLLFSHFKAICAAEGVDAEDAALRMIAAAAEGSVRDGLSILDQAIAHADMAHSDGGGSARVTAAQVQDMLGLSDGGATRRIFGQLLQGDGTGAIDEARAQYALGVEPISAVRGLMALVHGVALARVARCDDASLSPDDMAAINGWAAQIGMAQSQRLWQLLLRAHEEVARAADPFEALEMALLRLTHAARMPDPDQLARLLSEGGGTQAAGSLIAPPVAAPAVVPVAPLADPPVHAVSLKTPVQSYEVAEPAPEPAVDIVSSDEVIPSDDATLDQLASLLSDHGEHMLGSVLRRDARLIALSAGHVRLTRTDQIDDRTAAAIGAAVSRILDSAWVVELVDEVGAPTLLEQVATMAGHADAELRDHPIVAAVLTAFPNAILSAGAAPPYPGERGAV